MIKRVIILGFALKVFFGYSQDLHFSQFNQTPVLLNPATAGGHGADQRVQLNYRDQWRTVSKAFRTYALALDMGLKMKEGATNFFGFGLNVFADRMGEVALSTNQIDAVLAYHLALNRKNYFSVGVKGGYSQKSINGSGAKWSSQYNSILGDYDPTLPGETVGGAFFHPDLSAGIKWSFNGRDATLSSNDALRISAGLSALHLLPTQLRYKNGEKLYYTYIFNGGFSKGIKNTHLQIQPRVLIMMKKLATLYVMGTDIRYTLREESKMTAYIKGAYISVGAYYRYKDGMIISSFLEIDKISIGASYDINLSGLKPASKTIGGFEITLRYINPNPFGQKARIARFY